MNIFVLHREPLIAASHQCDKHVVKMVLETAQLLCSQFEEGIAPYKRTHYNHPCSKWARVSKDNFLWLHEHGVGLLEEYTRRYKKTHKCTPIIEWCFKNVEKVNFESDVFTEHAQAMPETYKHTDPVIAYRNYYLGDKIKFAKWAKGTEAPEWWTNALISHQVGDDQSSRIIS